MKQEQKKILRYSLWLIVLVIGAIYVVHTHSIKAPSSYHHNEGMIFGTFYHITYQYTEDLHQGIRNEMKRVDNSLSPFNKQSVITHINNNDSVTLDSLFLKVFHRAQTISAATDGAFDITVAPLVNTWGFGFKSGKDLTATQIDSLLQYVGYKKIHLTADNHIEKADPAMMLDCSAIAKGYACDVVGDYLRRQGVKNFMVEIGGEVTLSGERPNSGNWRIGVDKPIDDSLQVKNELELILQLSNCGMATSGNYRNFYYKNGKKYAHTIDPRTGYPVQHSVLSATVVAPDCLTADATATAFMVMGLEKAKEYITKHPEIKACLIYADGDSNNQLYISPTLKSAVVK